RLRNSRRLHRLDHRLRVRRLEKTANPSLTQLPYPPPSPSKTPQKVLTHWPSHGSPAYAAPLLKLASYQLDDPSGTQDAIDNCWSSGPIPTLNFPAAVAASGARNWPAVVAGIGGVDGNPPQGPFTNPNLTLPADPAEGGPTATVGPALTGTAAATSGPSAMSGATTTAPASSATAGASEAGGRDCIDDGGGPCALLLAVVIFQQRDPAARGSVGS
ncbi:hypothetical protein BDK51DRAFT_46254, partial [Blyttiomyces helicus]